MAGAIRNVARLTLAVAGAGISSISTGAPAEAPCCASGDHGIQAARADLGKVGTAAPNESRQPGWQAYVFTRGATRWVEVADANGVPRAAFTAVSGSLVTLPIGSDQVQQVAFAPPAASVVFEDGAITVGALTGSDGSTVWQVYVK